MKISVVVPVYGCPEALKILCQRTVNTLEKITKQYEIILVNDGCPKNSWTIIKELSKENKKIVGINLSRNFGQLHSTNAGINHAKGEYVVLMDCDLQDRPEAIIDLYNEIIKGYEVVFVKRKNRKDSKINLFMSKRFYELYNHYSDVHYDNEIGNFCIASRKAVEKYKEIKVHNKSFTIYLSWLGLKSSTIEIDSDTRFAGKSSYSINKKIDLAIDMLTFQSKKPLRDIMKLGFVISLASFIFLFIQICRFVFIGDAKEGWTSVIVAIFLMGGLILTCLGGIGIYVGNIFDQINGKQEYVIDEIVNDNQSKEKRQKLN